MDVDVQQFLSLGLPILVPAIVLLLLLAAALVWYVRRTKKRQRARRQRRRERAAARRSQSSSTSPALTPSAPPARPTSTPSLNINVSISRTPSRSGGCHGSYRNGGTVGSGTMPQHPPTYEEALRSGPPAIAATGADSVSGQRVVSLQRQPSDPPPPYDLGLSPNHPWSTPLNSLPSHRATPISIISSGCMAPCSLYPNSYHSTLSSSYTAAATGDNEVHQRSFSCPTPQTSSRTSTLEFGESESHQRSASHDPNTAGASSYDPEAIRNVAQHMYSETRRHCRGLTRARSRSGLALSLEDLASVGLTEERERKRREREARDIERQRERLSRPPRMQNIDSADTPQMIHRLLGERFPGVHYGSVTPSRIGGRYGSIANLDTPEDTQRVHYDSENSVDRRFSRRFRRQEARRGRYNSSVSLDTGRCFEEERNSNRQNNQVPQQQHQQQNHHQQLHQQLSANSLKRRQLISLGKTPSFISRILVSNATRRHPDSCDEQLLKPSDLLYTYRFTDDGGFEVGVVGENAEISTDFPPANVVCENSNGEVVYSLDSSTSSSRHNTSSLYDARNTPGGIELRMDPENGAVLYSQDLDGGGLSGIYV